jgi:hypothetical protein
VMEGLGCRAWQRSAPNKPIPASVGKIPPSSSATPRARTTTLIYHAVVMPICAGPLRGPVKRGAALLLPPDPDVQDNSPDPPRHPSPYTQDHYADRSGEMPPKDFTRHLKKTDFTEYNEAKVRVMKSIT